MFRGVSCFVERYDWDWPKSLAKRLRFNSTADPQGIADNKTTRRMSSTFPSLFVGDLLLAECLD